MSGDGGAVLTMPGIGAAYEIVLGDDGGLRYVDTEGVVLVGLDVEANSHVIAVSDPPVVLAPETVDGRRLGTPYARMVAALRALDPRAEVRLGQAADVDPAELVSAMATVTTPSWADVLSWLDHVDDGRAELLLADGSLVAERDRTQISFGWLTRGSRPMTMDAATATIAGALARAITAHADAPRLAWAGHFAASPTDDVNDRLAQGQPVAAVDVDAGRSVLLQLLITDADVALVGRSKSAELTCVLGHDDAVFSLLAAVAGTRPVIDPLTFRVRSSEGEQESPALESVEDAAVWLTETFDRLADQVGDEGSVD